MANAVVLPYVMEYNAESCPKQMAELAKAIDLPVSGNPRERFSSVCGGIEKADSQAEDQDVI